jgi:uncharacterized OB-fold protein
MDDRTLIFEQQISLPYSYTAGAVQRAALEGLKAGTIIASTGPGHTVVPARPFAPDGTALPDTVCLSDEGALEASTVAHHRPGAPAFGLIRLEGAGTLLFHRLGGGAEELSAGARVRAVWRTERTGSILDVEHFAPA